ncbi:MAG: sulfatase-like hydrolase/transferase, partial [Firmicutes bacterium]|nr:sulfatase-like hydrolase/transferase [Bacillota bacterium]
YRGNDNIVHPEFYGMISNIDDNFGRLRQKLTEWGVEDNTILVFMTDNGSSGSSELDENEHVIRGYNAGMRGMKASYYDGGHRVPFIIRWPDGGVGGGRDIEYTSFHVDFFPTLADMCNLSMPHLILDGISLKKALYCEGGLPQGRTEFMQYHQSTLVPDKWTNAVISDQWRLVYGKELYNIKDDPGQKHDVSAQHPDVVRRLRDAHEAYWQDAQGTMGVYSPIYLGDEHENPTRLDAMDVMGDVAWSQLSVALAQKSAGRWRVKFTRLGMYRFLLTRWPKELGLKMDKQPSAEERRELAPYLDAVRYWKQCGDPQASRIARGGIAFFDKNEEKPLDHEAKGADFV